MNNVYRRFYRQFYNHTGGFIPAQPLNRNLYPGDFFQISNGEMIVFGNIFRNSIVERANAVIGSGNGQIASTWTFSDGVAKPYSGRGTGQGPVGGEFEFSKQVLAFDRRGSFIFKAHDLHSLRILNWAEMQQQLIIRMTQTVYSFRQLYIVTETVAASDWTLAVAGAENGELQIATEAENFGLVDIFGQKTVRTIESRDIEYYHYEDRKRPCFFKAKKLVVQDDRLEVFMSGLVAHQGDMHEWARDFFKKDYDHESVYIDHDPANKQAGLLDMLQADELNPNTALSYFRWSNATLDDIEKLFPLYG